MKIVVGSDHGGFRLKEAVKGRLAAHGIEVEDVGARDAQATDYPDFARIVSERVSRGEAEQGVLVCTTGHGMTMAANKFPQVRAALCLSADMAALARAHNNANVLSLAGKYTSPEEAKAIVDAWLADANSWVNVERHARRVRKMEEYAAEAQEEAAVFDEDREVCAAIRAERERERTTVNLIASENYASRAVREAQGCVMTDKYAEGYPGKRWYDGCGNVDAVESLAIERARALFGAEHVNAQPHCGSAANMAAYFALLQPGDVALGMSLAHGGHLTHGLDANFSGRFFKFVPYGVSRKDERIDYDEVAALARRHKPKLIVAGASAYSRLLDFERFRAIADSVGALLMVDMAHIAGLVAGGAHPSPVPFADAITTTTHKTLRGPRSGMILCRNTRAAKIDRQVFPGIQGGPQMHAIAAKAVCLHEAMKPSFADYARQVVRNARRLGERLADADYRLVSGGTDNHLALVDVFSRNITGRAAADALDRAAITVNKNAIPFDTNSPFVTSGIRIGSAAVTTRGMKEPEMEIIGAMMARVLADLRNEAVQQKVREQVGELTARFPLP
ncbi:MAG: ribose 5-phosphate isomerase B [Verrucomicrobiota bacterium]|nr:ribose 5-phosphate isomerase B [Verrucomicrobiota bacterium]